MAFWNKEKPHTSIESCPSLTWDQAKVITSVEAESGTLVPGWYVYKYGKLWYAMKPGENSRGFQRSDGFENITSAQEWLGLPVPLNILKEEAERIALEERLAQAKAKAAPVQTTPYIPPQVDEKPVESMPDVKKQRRASNRKRNIGVYFQMTPAEYSKLQHRIEEAEMSQTSFIIEAALNSKIVIDPHKEELIQEIRSMNASLQNVRSELGKLGGMLKMVIKPNEGQRLLHPEEWDALIQATHSIFNARKMTEKTMEKISGYIKTHKL